ncbi:bifunctional protein-serine/threonine kinase/phosphatase [Nitrosophilus alvini]|uniref:bifunctional protein-serine/threonine kinase/phosphatase n=1 Tax=Nitrosophilus alvini TaxID=2714855 RepID=UPI00190E49B2|nr:bifunctional protein-serine/threonine kinase/phosphatase [Nitrosophilus alvini]
MDSKFLKAKISKSVTSKDNTVSDDFCDVKVYDDIIIAVLCDGVGSAQKGGEAARRAVEYFIKNFKIRPKSWSIKKSLLHFADSINKILFEESMHEYGRPELVTTLCVVVIDADECHGINIGDSRCYVAHPDNTVVQLSIDHTIKEEGMEHILSEALGLKKSITPAYFDIKIEDGASVMLCSDGVYNNIENRRLEELLVKKRDAKSLVKEALKNAVKATLDDASAVTIDVVNTNKLKKIAAQKLPIPDSLKAGKNIDSFLLKKPLIQNNRVWLAEKEGKKYVLKFPPLEAKRDEKILDAYLKEAWNANRIKAGFFVKAWIPENRSCRYYVMEYLEGETIDNAIKKRPLFVDDTVELGKFLLKASQYLLSLGLVHGDLKPENIIITKRDSKSVFKLIDYGSIIDMFSITSRAGTPSYLAPERFRGESISESTEIFAIGVTMYKALTGKYPYGEIEPFQTPQFSKPPQKISKYNKNVPGWLEAVILRAIERDIDSRYSHYSMMLYDLEHPEKVQPYLKNRPFIERNPLLFYKTLSALLALAIVLILGFCEK